MNIESKELNLDIEISPNIDPDSLNYLTDQLSTDLSYLDINSVRKAEVDEIPEGAMAADWIIVGGLVVKALPAIMPVVMVAVRSWIDRNKAAQNAANRQTMVRIRYDSFECTIFDSTTQLELDQQIEKLIERMEDD